MQGNIFFLNMRNIIEAVSRSTLLVSRRGFPLLENLTIVDLTDHSYHLRLQTPDLEDVLHRAVDSKFLALAADGLADVLPGALQE